MAVGDVTSPSRGSGARFNDGKTRWTLLPGFGWIEAAKAAGLNTRLELEVQHLADLWDGVVDPEEVISGLIQRLTLEELEGAAQVFAYGAKKYAAWNWAKGMLWSIPLDCYLRHTLGYYCEANDEESGLPHRYHAVCNLIMLHHFIFHCPDMDDRPEALTPAFHRAGLEVERDPLAPTNELPWMAGPPVETLPRCIHELGTEELNDLGEAVAEEQDKRYRAMYERREA